MSSVAPDNYFVKHHNGFTITFNLASVVRLKGTDHRKISEKLRSTEEHPLIVRLKLGNGENPSPWIVCHHGHREVFRSPLFVQARQNVEEPRTVHVGLRSWTNRKDPITRPFLLSFLSTQEAKSFVFDFNCFLESYVPVEGSREDARLKEEDNKEKKDDIEDLEEAAENTAEKANEEQNEERSEDSNDENEFNDPWAYKETQDPFPDYISD